MNWIPVEEKLPDKKINIFNIEEEIEVLVFNGSSIRVAWIHQREPILWKYSYCCGCIIVNVTHWMPLPNPPEEIK